MRIGLRPSAVQNHEGLGPRRPHAMKRWRGISVVLLTFSGVYLYALPSATIPYGAIVLLHATLGIILAAPLLPWFVRLFPAESLLTRVGWFFMALGAGLGVALVFLGTPHRLRAWLYLHIFLCGAGVVLLAISWLAARGRLASGLLRFGTVLALAVAVSAGGWGISAGFFGKRHPPPKPANTPAPRGWEGDA